MTSRGKLIRRDTALQLEQASGMNTRTAQSIPLKESKMSETPRYFKSYIHILVVYH
jgi:hypothetical protein